MTLLCVKCELGPEDCAKIVHYGRYYRTSDSRWVQRYRCTRCKYTFSKATFDVFFRHRLRRKHRALGELLCSSVSQRRAARVLGMDKKTVVRKFRLLSLSAEFSFRSTNLLQARAQEIEFDDLETFEHSKCKPLSVTLAVESTTRRILGLSVSEMPAKGLLARGARRKYGRRRDERTRERRRLFAKIQALVAPTAVIKSDSNPHYRSDVTHYFPQAEYRQYQGKRGSLGGQGELKKVRFDPLFSLNHTCAKLRADVNRLVRRTWCTTKRKACLEAHLILYADYHNRNLVPH